MSVDGHRVSNTVISAYRSVGVNPVDSDDDSNVECHDDDERYDAIRDEFEVLEDVLHEEVVFVGTARRS